MGGAQHLVDTARQSGYTPRGNEQQQILGAFKHLENQGGPGGKQDHLSDLIGKYLPGLAGKVTPLHIVGALFGFWLIHKLSKRQRS